jgi:hypothetical protein
MRTTINNVAQYLLNRSIRLIRKLDARIEVIMTGWIAIMLATGMVKLVRAPVPPRDILALICEFLPFALAALAPVAGYRLAEASFRSGLLIGQPWLRPARISRWQKLDLLTARRHPAYGPAGFLASLTFGILLNIPVRTMEWLTALPVLDARAPDWVYVLGMSMTGDLLLMNFLYAACFLMAMRSVPLFPRMLLLCWAMDILAQFAIAHTMARMPSLPPEVRTALTHLLEGNIDKVLISVLIWLPYLILSERVNVTFRWRCAPGHMD